MWTTDTNRGAPGFDLGREPCGHLTLGLPLRRVQSVRDRNKSVQRRSAPRGRVKSRPEIALAVALIAALANVPLAAAGDAPVPVAAAAASASGAPSTPSAAPVSTSSAGAPGGAAPAAGAPTSLVRVLAPDSARAGALASNAPGEASAPGGTGGTSAPAAGGASAPAAAQKVAAPQGVIVVAIGDDAGPAARALAREIYGDEALRPRIDDATARVLAGEEPKPGAAAKLTEIAELRKAAHEAQADAVTRRLYASLGADLGAALVVPVAIRDGRPTARVLSVDKAAFEPLVLSGSNEADSTTGTTRVTWPGVAPVLTTFLPKAAHPTSSAPIGATNSAPGATGTPGATGGAAGAAKPGPLAPKKEEPARSFWTSPWTWVGVGAVVVAGVVVFAASQAQGDAGSLRLQGRVSP